MKIPCFFKSGKLIHKKSPISDPKTPYARPFLQRWVGVVYIEGEIFEFEIRIHRSFSRHWERRCEKLWFRKRRGTVHAVWSCCRCWLLLVFWVSSWTGRVLARKGSRRNLVCGTYCLKWFFWLKLDLSRML